MPLTPTATPRLARDRLGAARAFARTTAAEAGGSSSAAAAPRDDRWAPTPRRWRRSARRCSTTAAAPRSRPRAMPTGRAGSVSLARHGALRPRARYKVFVECRGRGLRRGGRAQLGPRRLQLGDVRRARARSARSPTCRDGRHRARLRRRPTCPRGWPRAGARPRGVDVTGPSWRPRAGCRRATTSTSRSSRPARRPRRCGRPPPTW